MAADGNEDEDDYLSMTFAEAPRKESSLQRTTRLKKQAAERAHSLSKADQAAKDKAELAASLNRQLDASNKGAQMLARMGFKGGALGKAEDGRTQPVSVVLKDDRGGIGLDSERKRKLQEASAGAEKLRKVTVEEFVQRARSEREEKHAQSQMWAAMKTLESIEDAPDRGHGAGQKVEDASGQSGEIERVVEPAQKSGAAAAAAAHVPLRSVNVLYRGLLKQRQENERERRMRHDLAQSLSRRSDYNDPDADEDDKLAYGAEVEEDLAENDPELEEFESLSFAERLQKIVEHLRREHHYCFWCKFQYPDESMDGCPGLTDDEHG